MKGPPFRSTARSILIVGAPMALLPGFMSEWRVRGTLQAELRARGPLDPPHPWLWTAAVALVLLAPYAAVLALSSAKQSPAQQQFARGIAVGAAIAAMLALSFSFLIFVLSTMAFGAEAWMSLAIVGSALLIVMNARMLCAACRGAAIQGAAFARGAAAAIAFAYLALAIVRQRI